MTTIHWFRPSGKTISVRVETFTTKKLALEAISKNQVEKIKRLPNAGGRLYAVQLKTK